MEKQAIDAAVEDLAKIRVTGQALDKSTATAMPADIEDAYTVQDALVTRLGGTPVGWKIGCTSKMAQRMSETDEPFYGHMFAETTYDSPATIGTERLFAPIVEPEIAFRLGRPLTPSDSPFGVGDILDAVDAMYPAIEIVDCRYAGGWPITIVPTVADNGVHAAFVLGAEVPDWRAVDRTAIPVRVDVNGTQATDGIGANALDDPINAMVWLANRCTGRGHRLEKGALFTTGNTANAPVFAKAGDAVVADFGSLGDVRVSFG